MVGSGPKCPSNMLNQFSKGERFIARKIIGSAFNSRCSPADLWDEVLGPELISQERAADTLYSPLILLSPRRQGRCPPPAAGGIDLRHIAETRFLCHFSAAAGVCCAGGGGKSGLRHDLKGKLGSCTLRNPLVRCGASRQVTPAHLWRWTRRPDGGILPSAPGLSNVRSRGRL
jgi:hypothetical protein